MPSNAEALFEQIEQMSERDRTLLIEGWPHMDIKESEFLEFKNSARCIPKCTDPDDRDAVTWSKIVSAFANSAGGLVVWGIDARREKPAEGGRPVDALKLSPIDRTSQFVQFLKDKLLGCTNEPVPGVRYLEVPSSTDGGYVVCLIPTGPNKPYRSMRQKGEPYEFRIGDSTMTIPHQMLRQMFFPRLQAKFSVELRATWESDDEFRLTFYVINVGTSTAKDAVIRGASSPGFDRQARHGFAGSGIGEYQFRYFSHEPLHPHDGSPVFQCWMVRRGQQRHEFLERLTNLAINLSVFCQDHEPQDLSYVFSTPTIHNPAAKPLICSPGLSKSAPDPRSRLV